MKGAKQLRNMICNILENSDAVSGVTLKNSPNSSTLLLDRADGKGRMTFHTLFPGLTLAFIYVNITSIKLFLILLRISFVIFFVLFN